jgi:hypothetical protein
MAPWTAVIGEVVHDHGGGVGAGAGSADRLYALGLRLEVCVAGSLN